MTTLTPTGRPTDEELRAQRDESAFLQEMRERFAFAKEQTDETRRLALEDLEFFNGEGQWPPEIVEQRRRDGLPCLVFNRMKELAAQVINNQRQGRPGIVISPKGGGATLETAQIIQGLVRNIEVTSDAELAYDNAFQYAVIGGYGGWIRIVTEYADDGGHPLDQDIKIKRVMDPFSIYFDPTCQEPDYSDGDYAFAISDLTETQYRRRFKNSQLASLTEFSSVGSREPNWFRGGNIRIAEYFWVEKSPATMVLLADGETLVPEREVRENGTVATGDGYVPILLRDDGEPFMCEKETRTVRWATVNAIEILSPKIRKPGEYGKRWPGQWIPIIPVLGEELFIDGKRVYSGMVRDAKDAQRQYNFQRTALTIAIALAPKSPFIAATGQLKGHFRQWQNANRSQDTVLLYEAVVIQVNGQQVVLPPPQRSSAEPPIAAIAAAVAQADQDLKSTMRIHEPQIGGMSREESGIAVRTRVSQGNLASFSYTDNLSRSTRQLGRVLVDLIPHFYDRPGRVIRIVKPDQTYDQAMLLEPYQNKKGETVYFDLARGKYAVTVSAGPGYETRRQEFVASVLQLVQTAPQIAQFIMDLVVRHMDWPGAQEIADRLKKMLPPQLQEQEGQAAGAQVPPEFQARMEALLQQQALLVEQLNQATSAVEARRMELESRERVAELQSKTQILIAELKAEHTESIEGLRQEVAVLRAQHAQPVPLAA